MMTGFPAHIKNGSIFSVFLFVTFPIYRPTVVLEQQQVFILHLRATKSKVKLAGCGMNNLAVFMDPYKIMVLQYKNLLTPRRTLCHFYKLILISMLCNDNYPVFDNKRRLATGHIG